MRIASGCRLERPRRPSTRTGAAGGALGEGGDAANGRLDAGYFGKRREVPTEISDAFVTRGECNCYPKNCPRITHIKVDYNGTINSRKNKSFLEYAKILLGLS
ncbi:hypothetical protein KM043_013355 [Ampulex compressa]|nr:hypothetical protein KM043_013355 [Ampulex compressa]